MSTRITKSLILLITLNIPLHATGDAVYRSVGEDGGVIFSDTPPPDGEKADKIVLPPAPTSGSRKKSEARHEAIQKRVDEMQRARTQKEKAKNRQVRSAEKQLADAEAELAEAKRLREDDRQSLASGKRRIKPEYFERVKQAEQKVETAQKNLNRIRQSR